MIVKFILKSKEGLCVERDNIDKIAMSNDMVVLQYKFRGKEHTDVISKKDIRYVKVIPERKEENDN